MASPLTAVEELVLWSMGKIVCGVGFCGVVVSLFHDVIATGLPASRSVVGPMQVAGVISFSVVFALGMYADKFLNTTVRQIINEWAGK